MNIKCYLAAALALVVSAVLLSGCARPPVAQFISIQISSATWEFRFSGFDPDGRLEKIEWTFGDGGSAEGTTVQHTYTASDTYTVTAIAWDDDGQSERCSREVVAVREILVPAEFPTIQEAIDAAEEGESVLIASGTYNERIHFRGKAITVRASGSVTIAAPRTADSDSVGPTVSFVSGEGRDSVLEGVTVQGSTFQTAYAGGCVNIVGSSPTLRDCTFTRGRAQIGGGVYCAESHALLEGCEVSDCQAMLNGGGLYAAGTGRFPEIRGCLIVGNRAEVGGGMYFCATLNCDIDTSACLPAIDGNDIRNNRATAAQSSQDTLGGGIHVGSGLGLLVTQANSFSGNYPIDIGYDAPR